MAEFLAGVPLFAGLAPELRETLATHARGVGLAPASGCFARAIRATRPSSCATGRLQVLDETTGTVIRELGRGDALGELALLTDSPRSASVRSARASELLAIDRDEFERLLHASPALSLALNRALATAAARTRAPVAATRPRPATVALVALDERVPLDDLARALETALAASCPPSCWPGGLARRRGTRAWTAPPSAFTRRCSTAPRRPATSCCSMPGGSARRRRGRSSACSRRTGSSR